MLLWLVCGRPFLRLRLLAVMPQVVRRCVATPLNATCPLDGRDINTAFADDCGSVVTGSSLETLAHLARIDDSRRIAASLALVIFSAALRLSRARSDSGCIAKHCLINFRCREHSSLAFIKKVCSSVFLCFFDAKFSMVLSKRSCVK